MAEGLFLVVLLFASVMLLYYLVRTEHGQRETMSRQEAE